MLQKKIFRSIGVSIIMVFSSLLSAAQNEIIETANEQNYTLYSSEYQNATKVLERFVKSSGYTLVSQTESKVSHHYEFYIPETDLSLLDSLVSELGYISSRQLISHNNEDRLQQLLLDLDNLELKKKEYDKMLLRLEGDTTGLYYNHWEKIIAIESEITMAKKRIAQLKIVSPLFDVKIDIIDDQANPTNNRITFVNMPGVQYSYLIVDNPTANVSRANYQGFAMKYNFTKGKSYATLGVLKSMHQEANDSTSYTQMFNVSLGQDFYSNRFGRGSRRWFNLYVGYQVGLSTLHSSYSRTNGFVAPGMGLEILKTKNFLLDTHGNYYLPIGPLSFNFRGWMVGASFSFVF